MTSHKMMQYPRNK